MAEASNYYELLGVSRRASPREIKAQYRKMAMLYHPDQNIGVTGSSAAGNEERFRLISDAYETLMCPSKRAQYDTRLAANRSFQAKNPYTTTDIHGRPVAVTWRSRLRNPRTLAFLGLSVAAVVGFGILLSDDSGASSSKPHRRRQRRSAAPQPETATGRKSSSLSDDDKVPAVWDAQQKRWVEWSASKSRRRGTTSSMRMLPRHVLDYSGKWNAAEAEMKIGDPPQPNARGEQQPPVRPREHKLLT